MAPDLSDDERFALPGAGLARPLVVGGLVQRGGGLITVGELPAHLLTTTEPSDGLLREQAWATQREQVANYMRNYPDIDTCVSALPTHGPLTLTLTNGATFEVQIRLRSSGVGPGTPVDPSVIAMPLTVGLRGDRRYVFPQIGGSNRAGHPFLVWWALTFALSMLARYEPRGWAERISIEHCADALPIEHLLERALSDLPELIHRTIMHVSVDA